MTGFDLPQNFHSDPESLLRKTRARLVSPRRSLSAVDQVIASSSAPRAMAQKTLHDYSAPSANQVPTGPEVNTGGKNFEIKMGLITMVQASPFYGKANEDASANLQQFLELCSTFVMKAPTSIFGAVAGEDIDCSYIGISYEQNRNWYSLAK